MVILAISFKVPRCYLTSIASLNNLHYPNYSCKTFLLCDTVIPNWLGLLLGIRIDFVCII